MRLLLDTHAFLWAIAEEERLSQRVRDLLQDLNNDVLVSLASIWEIAIKAGLGHLDVPDDLEGFIAKQLSRTGIAMLPIEFRHVVGVRDLPMHHRDPFDRLLIAQSRIERIPIISVDARFNAYGVDIVW